MLSRISRVWWVAISTDPPGVAESSTAVPQGSFQAENGFLITHSQGQRSFDGPETWMRFGVAGRAELRFSAPDYYGDVPAGPAIVSGFGDLSVGIKQQLGPIGGFDVSIVVYVSLPTGARALTSHSYDPALQLPWSRKLSPSWSAGGQFALYWPTQRDARNRTAEATFLLDRQLAKPLDGFIEYAGDFPQRGGPRHLLHAGAAYQIAPHHQVDIHYGIGLSSAAVHRFIGVGDSFRFQPLHR